ETKPNPNETKLKFLISLKKRQTSRTQTQELLTAQEIESYRRQVSQLFPRDLFPAIPDLGLAPVEGDPFQYFRIGGFQGSKPDSGKEQLLEDFTRTFQTPLHPGRERGGGPGQIAVMPAAIHHGKMERETAHQPAHDRAFLGVIEYPGGNSAE